jgi:hypothetical protein
VTHKFLPLVATHDMLMAGYAYLEFIADEDAPVDLKVLWEMMCEKAPEMAEHV